MDDLLGKARSFGADKLKDYSSGLNFPATKDDIMQQARDKHLPPEVMKQLENIPDKKYDNIGEVISQAVRGAG